MTGGAGFIGSHLVDALLELGAEVTVLDNLSTGSRARAIRPEVERYRFVEADIRDPESCREALDGTAIVFHQAALGSVPRSIDDPISSFAVNLQGTVNLLQAARRCSVERFVYASSSSVYGDSEELPKREGEEGRALSPYAQSKRSCEEVANLFARSFELATIGLRYFNVYGPRQDPSGPYAAVIPRFFRALLEGERPTIYGDGEQSRDFTFVDDVVRANLLAATARRAACGRAYNVGGGERTTVAELARSIAHQVGSDLEPEHAAARPGDVAHSLADLSRVGEQIGYAPQTQLADGIAQSEAYYRTLCRSSSAEVSK